MTKKQLQTKRARLLREAEALRRSDGTFEHDEARAEFDGLMADVETVDAQLRALDTSDPAVPPDAEEIRQAERTRGLEIRRIVAVAKLPETVAEALVRSGATLDQARTKVLEDMSAAGGDEIDSRGAAIVPGEAAEDKWCRGVEASLIARGGMTPLMQAEAKRQGQTEIPTFDPGEFRGLTLADLARESLQRAGVKTRGMDRMQIAGEVFNRRANGLATRGANYQTTSDFATLLENVMHKVLRAAYMLTADTWSLWCGVDTVTDFRTHNWYRLGSLTALDALNEHGEYQNKTIPDAEKATFSASTKGNIIAVTRQTIVNDDLGGLMRMNTQIGRAAKLTIEQDVYALLALNSGLGPTQSDAQALFHSNRSNVGSGAALTVASLDADRVVMASQLDPNGQDYIDLRPSVLLVPVGLGGEARVLNAAEFDPVDNKFRKPNIVRGLFSTVVDTPRLSGTRRYLFADPSSAPVFLVAFLEGMQEPVLEARDGWRVDGVEMRARLDFGVNVVDYRGAVTNAGA